MKGLNIKSVLVSSSAESAEVAALEEEMASELAKETDTRARGSSENSPEVDESPAITPSKRAEIER